MTLKSRSKLHREQSKAMDIMDVNRVVEVPDTPDRLVAAAHNRDRNSIARRSDASMNDHMTSKDYNNGAMRNHSREKGKLVTVNGNQRLFIHPDGCSNSLVSQSGSSGSLATPAVDTTRHDKGKALCNSDVQKSTCKKLGTFCLTEQNKHGHSVIGRVNASRKGVLSVSCFPAVDPLDGSSKSCKPNNTLKTGQISDCGNGIDILAAARHNAESKASACIQPCTSSKVPRRRMLVRNGCISPHNIAKSKHVAEKHETGNVVKEIQSGSGTMPSERQSSMVDIKDLIAEAKDSRRCEGKEVSRHLSWSEEPDARNGHLSHRISTLKELAGGSDFGVDSSRCYAESERWRSTHNHRKPRDNGQQKKVMMRMDHRNERDTEHRDESEIVSSSRMCDPPQTISPHVHLLGINRQREGTASRNFGKRSVSFVDSAGEPSTSRSKRNKGLLGVGTPNPMSEPNTRVCDPPETISPHVHLLGSNRQREGTASRNLGKHSMSIVDDSAVEPSTSRSKRNKSGLGVGTSNPVSEPNTHHGSNEESSVTARQVEADEMLARELQEQLYNEELTAAVEIDEMDSHLAFAMPSQQDGSSWNAGARHANRRRGPSLLNVHEHIRLSTSRRPSIRRRFQPEARTSTRMFQLRSRVLPQPRATSSTSYRRNSIFLPSMDVDMRIGILETLEAVNDMRMPNNLLQVGHEFNKDDYEMLLALDEDNHQHGGATCAQINNLPESAVQAENLQECAICLETPTVGETIRHLPCLHRFHKACIDQWLRRKTSCPVCKSSIT